MGLCLIGIYLQGKENKKSVLESLAREEKFELSQTLFVGNDINDFYAMKACGFSACPADSHRKILKKFFFHIH